MSTLLTNAAASTNSSTDIDHSGAMTLSHPLRPTAVIHEFARCFNQRDFDAIANVLHVDLVDHHLPPTMPPGRLGVQVWCQLLTDALDMRIEIDETVAVGALVAVRASITGTHCGEFGGLDATGRPFTTSMMSFERIEHGCIIERWEIVDHASVVDQLTIFDR